MEKDAKTPARSSPDAGVTPQTLNTAIEAIRKGRTADSRLGREGQYDALKKYARDLTARRRATASSTR